MKKTVLICIVLAAALIPGCQKKQRGKNQIGREKFTVTTVDLRDIITQTGTVEPLIKVDLKSEASGKIEKIFVKEGQPIKKGDTILKIDPERLLNSKKKLLLSIERAKIDKKIADRNYASGLELVSTGGISTRQLDDLKNAADLASIQTSQQNLELEDLDNQLSKTIITAPMNGVITELLVEEGEIAVSATSGFQNGTSIGTIADIRKLEVVTSIGEVDYVHLKTGNEVIIRPEALEGISTKGHISFIALSAKKRDNSELSTFEVRVAIDSLIPGIAPGINVNVDFVILEKKGVLGVPYHFVKKEGPKTFVLTMKKSENGTPEYNPKPVKVGATDYKHYEILSGLQKGDQIVFKPIDLNNNKKNRGKGEGRGAGHR